MTPQRNTLEHVQNLCYQIIGLVEGWDHDRKVQMRYHAMGTSSAVDDDRVQASREPDQGTFNKAAKRDPLVAAYERAEHRVEKALRRLYEKYAYDMNPVVEADNDQRSA